MEHLNIADLQRVRSGAASAEETAAVGRHVAECGRCEALAGEVLAIRDSVAAFEAAFHWDEDGDEGAPDKVPEPRPLRPLVLWSGAAAAAIAAVVFLAPRTTEPEPPPRRAAAPVHRAAPPPDDPAPPVVRTRPAEWDALVSEVRRTRVLPFPAEIRELAANDSFRGDDTPDATTQAVWPAATAVEEAQPELRWPAMDDARCIVSISSGGEEIARSEALASARWRVPVPLRRGRTYRWQVSVERGEESFVLPAPPAPPAIFRVISTREQDQLARARTEAGGDHLLLGLLYARLGMVSDARRELSAYGRATADPLAQRLLQQLP
ncbi:MAG TPA: hypothetical protein VF883_04570 [Thermoanaerobaculia bacterium]